MRDHRAEVFLNVAPDDRSEDAALEPRAFRVLVLGDFSARGDDARATTDSPRRVDRDDLDAHLARIAPRLRVEIDGRIIDLAFTAMDDFHPDRLVARMASLDARAPRSDGRSSQDLPAANSVTTSRSASAPDLGRAVSGGSLLDDMLDDAVAPSTSSPSVAAPRAPDELSTFIDRAVAPHLVRAPDSDTVAQAAEASRETAKRLREILHHPRVQALESAWRSLELLVRRLDTDEDLALFLLDTPRAGIDGALERLARQRDVAGGEQWAMVISVHAFPEGDAGAEALARIAMGARGLEAPFIAGAPASLAGRASAPSLDDDAPASPEPEVYALIRRSLEARFLGLTFPRVLLRAPYGQDNPCDTVEFEEIDDPERHEDYLWGSGAVLVALLVGEAFNERGWAIGSRMALDVGSLPLFTYRRGPETIATSCAETIMSERVARHLLSRGLMPLAWIKNTDRVRVVELRSVAESGAPLAAAWSGATPGTST